MPRSLPSAHRPWWLRVHWPLLGVTMAIVALGLPFLRSAATRGEFLRQLVWLGLGAAAFAGMAWIDYRRWLRHAWLLYAGAAALLLLVLRLPAINNAHRWIALPGFSVQPSELLKPALVAMLAWYLSTREPIVTFRGLAIPFVLTLAPAYLVFRQPDLGTTLMLPPALLAMLLASGAGLWRLGAVAAAGVASLWPLWLWGVRDYHRLRIYAWLDPERHADGIAFHLLMGLAAIGLGGMKGRGIGNGTLNELDMLPEKHNDFIFGVIAEEGGLLAAGTMTGLFLLLTLTLLSIAGRAVDMGGRLVATGVATLVGGQALVNIGVVTGTLPTTGITLPLVSYGGSSMLATFAMLGLAMSVAAAEPDPRP